MRRFAIASACLLAVVGCSPGAVTSALSTPAGQLFCAIQTSGGGTTIAGLVDAAASSALPGAAPVAVLATNATVAQVNTACANAAAATGSTSGIPVSPPANPSATPTVAIPVPAGMPTSTASAATS